MSSRIRAGTLPFFVLLLSSLIVSSPSALEKTAVRVGDLDRPGDWGAFSTCQVAYYNYCTGWIWAWGSWSPNDVIGVCYETCVDPSLVGTVQATWELVYTSSPPGRCFTGTIDIWTADDNCCPASHLACSPFYFYSGWNGHAWGQLLATREFVVTVRFGYAPGAPSRLASDHPAAGPAGPQACGTCYQLNRLTRSYYYGTSTTMLCPGERMSDGVCDVEWVWDVAMSWVCTTTEASSWAAVKALYR